MFASDRAKGKRPRPAGVAGQDYLRPAAVKAGVIPRSTRAVLGGRTSGTHSPHSLDNEVNLPIIQAALRHAKAATTAKYIHRNNAVQDKVQSKFLEAKFLEAIKVAKTAAVN